MTSTPHDALAAPAAPAESAPSVPLTNAETPVNAPGPIVIDDFTDVGRFGAPGHPEINSS